MTWRPSVLCPVDFSDASRLALRYAVAIASHFGATVTLLTVNDPILAESANLELGPTWLRAECRAELESLAVQTLDGIARENVELQYEVATGAPGAEILRVARERHIDLVVMSSRGLSGMRKLFFGTTTERVLRETAVPVLVTPPSGSAPSTLEEVAAHVRRILAPVDLVASPVRQVGIASAIASALGARLLVLHILEPLRVPVPIQMSLPNVDAERRAEADRALATIAQTVAPGVAVEAITTFGDPAEEIAKVAADRQTGLVVMGLHASPLAGARMGSVTYRMLCLAHALVLAIPPAPPAASPA